MARSASWDKLFEVRARDLVVLAVGLGACGRLGFGDEGANPGGPVARFSMDGDPTTGVISDSVGGHHGRCTLLTCPAAVDGRFGNALAFDGIADVVRISDVPGLDGSQLTVSIWVYLEGAMSRPVLTKPYGSAAESSWSVSQDFGAAACFTASGDYLCSAQLPLGEWVQVAGVWDGTNVALFVDGTRAGIKTNLAPLAFDAHDILLGAGEYTGVVSRFWKGRVDELQLFDHALTELELAELAAGP